MYWKAMVLLPARLLNEACPLSSIPTSFFSIFHLIFVLFLGFYFIITHSFFVVVVVMVCFSCKGFRVFLL